MPCYVIRYDDWAVGDYHDDSMPRYSYVSTYRMEAGIGGTFYCVEEPVGALKFDTWSEAAAHAAFISRYLCDHFDGALDVVRIDP